MELENRMIKFINHEYDILLCTTIIETGIDIPNCNTLIVLDADRFGRVSDEILIYMYEEWFDKLARSKGIEEIKQTKDSIELIYNIDESKKINGEELFMKAYNISRNFSFSYHNLRLHITLSLKNLNKHPIYYLIDLLKDVK